MPTLTLLLDSNEYIFGLTKTQQSSTKLLNILSTFQVKLPRFIIDELHDNLDKATIKRLYLLIKKAGIDIIEEQVPLSLVKNYYKQLPPEDAVIAAYCEFLKIDILISENRHFLVDFNTKTFKIISAQKFLSELNLI